MAPTEETSPPAARRGRGSKPRVDREKRREDYLQAAAQVFLNKGLNLATMQEVADAASVPKVLIYRIFGSRKALLDAMCERVTDSIHGAYAEPYTRYGDRAVRIVRDAQDSPALFLLVLRYSRAGPEHGDWARAVWDTLTAYVQSRWFTPADGAPLGADLRARDAARQVVGPIIDLLINWIEGGDGLDPVARAAWWQQVSREYHRSLRAAYGLGESPHPYPFETHAGPGSF